MSGNYILQDKASQTQYSNFVVAFAGNDDDSLHVLNQFKKEMDITFHVHSFDNSYATLSKECRSVLLVLPTVSEKWNSIVNSIREKNTNVHILAAIRNQNKDILHKLVDTSIDDFLLVPARGEEIKKKFQRLLNVTNVPESDVIKKELILKFGLGQFIGASSQFLNAIKKIPIISKTDSPSLIMGETGTGKEMVARALHYLGSRSSQPFIPVNCGVLPEQLFENELFGHEKGAYTGALHKQEGLIHEARGGTLFLDEINTLNFSSQVKLLRFLEDGLYKPLGSSKYVQENVHIITATNVDLLTEIQEKRFREDLYYRINVLNIHLPPLRERTGDIFLLANHFLDKFSHQYEKGEMCFSADAMNKLTSYSWPGNVREMKNLIERLVVLIESSLIKAEDVVLPGDGTTPVGQRTFQDAREIVIHEFEKRFLSEILAANKWNVSRAAEQAHIDRRSLQRLIKKYNLHTAASY
ncbi:MAG: sigma-54-dependent Fis family transcriptional regulator [Ignavibacteriae bacterium]|nr:sigma-54-dependent Fis family transcriptional regulator [Ignavibacteriota bacterium]